MRKFLKDVKRRGGALLFCLVLMVGMISGCGSQTGGGNEDGKAGTEQADSQEKGQDKSQESSQDGEPLKIAMDLKYPPFTGTDEEGNPEGLEVDIAYALGEALGRPVEIIEEDFSMLITSLETGEADAVICEMSVNEERKEKVDFSHSYLYDHTLALVNKDFAEANKVTDDMTPEEFFALDADFVGLAGTIAVSYPQAYGVEVKELTEIASVLTEVDQGTSDVFVGANSILGCHAAYPDSTIVYSGIPDYSECAVAVKKGNTGLLDEINAFIDSMYEEGGFYVEAGNSYDKAIGDYLQDPTKGLDYIIYPPSKD